MRSAIECCMGRCREATAEVHRDVAGRSRSPSFARAYAFPTSLTGMIRVRCGAPSVETPGIAWSQRGDRFVADLQPFAMAAELVEVETLTMEIPQIELDGATPQGYLERTKVSAAHLPLRSATPCAYAHRIMWTTVRNLVVSTSESGSGAMPATSQALLSASAEVPRADDTQTHAARTMFSRLVKCPCGKMEVVGL